MSETENTSESTEETGEETAEETKARGTMGPPTPRGQQAKNLGKASRPGFRDPANKRSKATRKKRKK